MSDEWTLTKSTTPRGFVRYEFKDTHGTRCSIQESSLATSHCIWIDVGGEKAVHLGQDMAKALLPLLEHFVCTGKLPD